MCDPNYRLFVPVAVWYTRRSDITLQREMNLAEGVPAPMTAEELRHLDDAVERAAHRRVIAIFEARLEAEKWQNRANPGGGDTQC